MRPHAIAPKKEIPRFIPKRRRNRRTPKRFAQIRVIRGRFEFNSNFPGEAWSVRFAFAAGIHQFLGAIAAHDRVTALRCHGQRALELGERFFRPV